ncbi:3-deoxy-7-phosphoheptulonate synthase [Coxiella burnetii]|uniref:3-deoxy-7-phosphoheptulonate synthase n=1 Tax=Coxiella burnetii TaxID=777 RepID=UPI000183D0C9|nr:3-deoxy-7-phosphoheptulonate synthase [Coxiella burnetii]ACJ18372.1 3-deoxy-7-phosphoheptulonate synthase [Coxiella burnetii CbuG_Q212]ATN66748.1 phospho-2-dehydro-3-deoxyheptonate aldolase [Coxiella burnetii]OYK86075.1 3-deoxy-7-phosphoheptulonate synthase [Coxiella burnetii]
MQKTDNLRIKAIHPLMLPSLLIEELPITVAVASTVNLARLAARDIIHGQDDRLLVVLGPCSIHDVKAALEYANRLKRCIDRHAKELCIIMRVYFEKPRTTVGWKGLINDPQLDGSFQINQGLRVARRLLLDINEIGVPTGSEFLDTIIPQYISDLTSWSAIGARTTESQTHRELASGLSMPIGFKNGTTGNVQIAIDAVLAARQAHHFLGVSKQGIAAIIITKGNPDGHVILRGSSQNTNYDPKSIEEAILKLKANHLPPSVMVDCSHGNSRKNHKNQMRVVDALYDQITQGSSYLLGAMIESNLVEGKQTLESGKTLTYGQSITDACISWEDTELALEKLAQAVIIRRQHSEERKHHGE